jgi:hypothetical protein
MRSARRARSILRSRFNTGSVAASRSGPGPERPGKTVLGARFRAWTTALPAACGGRAAGTAAAAVEAVVAAGEEQVARAGERLVDGTLEGDWEAWARWLGPGEAV